MHLIFDHLIGIVVGAVVIFLMMGLYARTQDENIDALGSEASRARLLDLAHVLERDLRNTGSGATQPAIVSWSGGTPTEGAPVTVLEFFTRVDTSATATVGRVRYELAVAGAAEVDGTEVPLYELRRLGEAGGEYVRLSASSPTLTEFSLTMLDAGGAPTPDPAQARTFAVSVVNLSPFGADKLTKDSRWSTVIRPLNLPR